MHCSTGSRWVLLLALVVDVDYVLCSVVEFANPVGLSSWSMLATLPFMHSLNAQQVGDAAVQALLLLVWCAT
jgi:hypothetical protein